MKLSKSKHLFLGRWSKFAQYVTELILFQLTGRQSSKLELKLTSLAGKRHTDLFRWAFTHLLHSPSVPSLFFILSLHSPAVQSQDNQSQRGQTSLCLIHKQPIVMQSGLALHLIFTYLNTSPAPLPPRTTPPSPSPSTDFMSRPWNETVAFSIGAVTRERRGRMKYFFSPTDICSRLFIWDKLLIAALYNSCLITTSSSMPRLIMKHWSCFK